MEDDEFIAAYAMIDQKGVTGDRKDAHSGYVSLSPKRRVLGQQLARRTYSAHDRCRGDFIVP